MKDVFCLRLGRDGRGGHGSNALKRTTTGIETSFCKKNKKRKDLAKGHHEIGVGCLGGGCIHMINWIKVLCMLFCLEY